jgi:hypothetical protein
MNLDGVVDYRDGWLCVRYDDNHFDRPERIQTFWPVRQESRSYVQDLIGSPASYDGHGSYAALIPGTIRMYERLPLLNGGQTQPIATNVEPLPCPKVRKGIPTKYARGQWWKLLKTEGWIPA